MPAFSPISIYERGRLETTANQPRYYERFRQLLTMGTALVILKGDDHPWLVLAPSSRLEPRVLFAQDLAVDGEAGLHRIEFEEVSIPPRDDEAWGSFYVGGWPVAEFRPIAFCDSPEWVELWNSRSGCPPVKLIPESPFA
jgi:hypothetical protein